jgi:hypothetical protein
MLKYRMIQHHRCGVDKEEILTLKQDKTGNGPGLGQTQTCGGAKPNGSNL